MDKFNCTLRGYDKNEVNAFIDDIITRVEKMVKEIEEKDKKILAYKKIIKKNKLLMKNMSLEIEKLANKEELTREFSLPDDSLERSKIDSKKILDDAKLKSQKIIEEAEENADIIINECLMNAKKSEMELNNLKKEIERLKQKKEMLYYS